MNPYLFIDVLDQLLMHQSLVKLHVRSDGIIDENLGTYIFSNSNADVTIGISLFVVDVCGYSHHFEPRT